MTESEVLKTALEFVAAIHKISKTPDIPISSRVFEKTMGILRKNSNNYYAKNYYIQLKLILELASRAKAINYINCNNGFTIIKPSQKLQEILDNSNNPNDIIDLAKNYCMGVGIPSS